MMGKAELMDAIGKIAAYKQLSRTSYFDSDRPVEDPTEALCDLLDGNWRPLSTTSKSLLNIDALPLLKLGQISSVSAKTASVSTQLRFMGCPIWKD